MARSFDTWPLLLAEKPNQPSLRACCERPRNRRAAEQRDEVASAAHSITSSARATRLFGIVRPSIFAVCRLMTNSNAPLIERKRVLRSFLTEAESSAPGVIYSEHFDDGIDLYKRAFRMGLEGVVSKRADAPYRSGRTEAWVKVKCWKRDRFVVVGFVPDGAGGLAKLRLARREGRKLIYAGRVGTGWDHKTARAIRRALEPLARSTSPLTTPIRKRDTTWVEPRYDAEVTYADITDDGMVRHPSFKSLTRREGTATKK
jgi:ATP-dependent DNA ligase